MYINFLRGLKGENHTLYDLIYQMNVSEKRRGNQKINNLDTGNIVHKTQDEYK
jgi:hypothetical protein